jgi:hypothetical protein
MIEDVLAHVVIVPPRSVGVGSAGVGTGIRSSTAIGHQEDARWRTVEEGTTNREGRSTIVHIMRRGLAGRPFDGGIADMVVTILAGQITELKGCADRAAAVDYAETGGSTAAS